MAKKDYERLWDALDQSGLVADQRSLLIEWAKQSDPLSNDQLLFILDKVVELKDQDLYNKYRDYINDAVFTDKDRGKSFIESIDNEDVIVLALDTIRQNIEQNLIYVIYFKNKEISDAVCGRLIMNLRDSLKFDSDFEKKINHIAIFRKFLDDKNYPIIDSMLEQVQNKAYEEMMLFIRKILKNIMNSEEIDEVEEISKALNSLFTTTVLTENTKYIELIFDRGSIQDPADLFRVLAHLQQLKAIDQEIMLKLKNTASKYFRFYQYARVSSNEEFSDQEKQNLLVIRMANFVDFGQGKSELKKKFFDQLSDVFEDIIDNPKEDYLHENLRCFNQIDNLSDAILDDFVAYLYEEKQEVFNKISAQVYAVSKDNIFPHRVFEKFENQRYTFKTFSDSEVWEQERDAILEKMQNTGEEVDVSHIETALNHIADHVKKHLSKEPTSTRAKAGQQKEQDLVALFDQLSKAKDLHEARDVLIECLDKDPKESNLLKNRGGFFGAYKTFSKLYSKIGLLHYGYTKTDGTKRTAESTTDHLLIALLDSIDEQLVSLDHSVDNSK